MPFTAARCAGFGILELLEFLEVTVEAWEFNLEAAFGLNFVWGIVPRPWMVAARLHEDHV